MKKLRTRISVLSASLALACASFTLPGLQREAHAGTNTIAIFTNTVKAYPSCLKLEVKGMCFFLHCSIRGCWIRSSIKVSHYVPDVIISTYNEPALHPWDDIGKLVAVGSNTLGSMMLGSAFADSSAGSHADTTRFAVYKGADAYGNPVGLIGQLLTGGLGNFLVMFRVPGTNNLTGFIRHELPRIPGMWANVPQDLLDTVLGEVMETIRRPLELVEKVDRAITALSTAQTAAGMLNGITPQQVLSFVGIDIGPLIELYNTINSVLGGGGSFVSIGPATFCPGGASLMTLHFQSEIDGYFWRGVIPLESLYPSSWLPLGANEVGSWGGRFPRTGEIVQQDPVRASGVIAERVASIIRSTNQPHIYTELRLSSSYKYFDEPEANRRWQRLYPDAETSCHVFGGTLKEYGPSERTITDGYVWNLWNKYTCCQKRGVYLYSIP